MLLEAFTEDDEELYALPRATNTGRRRLNNEGLSLLSCTIQACSEKVGGLSPVRVALRVSLLMTVGTAPWAVASSEHSELGVMSVITCQADFDAEQGAGSLLLTGEGLSRRGCTHACYHAS